MFNRVLKRAVVGAPIATAKQQDERVTVPVGMAVLSSDPISSVSYSTEAILLVLVCGGLAATKALIPIVLALAVLLTVLTFSYRQTIKAYPLGGGAYTVAKNNFGKYVGMIAGASLLVDYVLTAAVSVSAGVSAIVSALPADAWLAQGNHRAYLAVACLGIIALVNLRGAREAGKVFAAPTYIFVGSFVTMLAFGFYRWYSTGVGAPAPEVVGRDPGVHFGDVGTLGTAALAMFFLRAFAAGCTALTGVEATSNGIKLFREKPVSAAHNAAKSLLAMFAIMVTLIVGSGVLASTVGVLPTSHGETVVSQLARYAFGGGPAYWMMQVSTFMILVFAANTAFTGFPALASMMALDGYVPRQLANRGDRLAFSNGIVALAVLASVLVLVFGGREHAMLPLYALGVFVGFTLSQLGMVRKGLLERKNGAADAPSRGAVLLSLGGGIITGIVMIVIAVTKFHEGAWAIVLIVPLLVTLFWATNRHYVNVGKVLARKPESGIAVAELRARLARRKTILLTGGINATTRWSVEYARAHSDGPFEAVTVEQDAERTPKLKEDWYREFGDDVPLRVLESPYRSLAQPVIEMVRRYNAEGRVVTLIVGELVMPGIVALALHNRSTDQLREALAHELLEVAVMYVPYHL